MTPIHSPIEQFIIILFLKVLFFPSAKSNILKEILGVGGKDNETRPTFLRTLESF